MFHVKSIEETLAVIQRYFNNYPRKTIVINTNDARNFIVSKDIISKEDVPHFNRSTVDGYACKSEDVRFASASSPAILKIIGEVNMGKGFNLEMKSNQAVYVPTGGYLPEGADCSVMIENTEVLNNEVFIQKSASKSENVFYKASDIAINDIVLKKGSVMTPFIIGALNSLGINQIEVYQPLKATIISTGNEIVENKENLEIGEIRDINTSMITSYLERKNIEVIKKVIIRDDLLEYTKAVKEAFLSSDIVISSGGSSVGEEDYTVKVMEELDAELYVHGINIKPGKPTIIAKHKDKMFLGLPGQPTSAYMVLNTLFPTIYNTIYQIDKQFFRPYLEATLTKNVHSPSGRRLYQLVTLAQDGNQIMATPLFKKSGMIHSLTQADGYIIISEYNEGSIEGETVKVYRLED